MRAIEALAATLLAVVAAGAQVLAPEEIRDPQISTLQQKYRSELRLIPSAAAANNLPYHFYFSRKLDLEEKDQKRSDQRSIQFDRYQGRIVLKITGNYFVSYSAELIKPEDRARRTYEAVMLPLLRAAVQALGTADAPQAFAFEISHHVRRKVLGVSSEAVENVVLVLPKASAQRLVASADSHAEQAAVLEGEAFLNAIPISFWPRPAEEIARETDLTSPPARVPAPAVQPAPTVSPLLMKGFTVPNVTAAKVVPEPPAPVAPSHDSSPEATKDLQKSYQPTIDRMVQELEPQAHFVRYALPSFILFHNGSYLQLSLTTTLPESAAGSQYRMAALAFDQHIAHLVRPVLAYFKDRGDFDGVDFSTTMRLAPAQNVGESSLAVEFIFPLKLLGAYAEFDATGQQLIDGSFVLVNGERVSLNLQVAEAGAALP